MSGTHDCGADAAAYALGALEPDEAERFRAHLDECVVCRDELSAFQQVAGALPMAAPQYRAPRGLRRRVLTQVRTEARPRAESSRAPRASPRFRPAWAGAAPRGWRLGGAVAVAVAVVVAVGSSGSSTRVYSAYLGHAQLRVTGGHGELVVNHLPAPSRRPHLRGLAEDGERRAAADQGAVQRHLVAAPPTSTCRATARHQHRDGHPGAGGRIAPPDQPCGDRRPSLIRSGEPPVSGAGNPFRLEQRWVSTIRFTWQYC